MKTLRLASALAAFVFFAQYSMAQLPGNFLNGNDGAPDKNPDVAFGPPTSPCIYCDIDFQRLYNYTRIKARTPGAAGQPYRDLFRFVNKFRRGNATKEQTQQVLKDALCTIEGGPTELPPGFPTM